ncbi:hypothetical protein C1646_753742 [Rhizophagus diaphanus]|nr:hypothetical protein C1646_753742 [Rhizophagus diaphanus] [Rhizophagus sp. MUCL 43196]
MKLKEEFPHNHRKLYKLLKWSFAQQNVQNDPTECEWSKDDITKIESIYSWPLEYHTVRNGPTMNNLYRFINIGYENIYAKIGIPEKFEDYEVFL